MIRGARDRGSFGLLAVVSDRDRLVSALALGKCRGEDVAV